VRNIRMLKSSDLDFFDGSIDQSNCLQMLRTFVLPQVKARTKESTLQKYFFQQNS
jgi:hypothetical protein